MRPARSACCTPTATSAVAELFKGAARPVVALPTYAFRRQRYWLEPTRSTPMLPRWALTLSASASGSGHHARQQDGVLFTTRLSLATILARRPHCLRQQRSWPAALELALAAAQRWAVTTVGAHLSAALALSLQGALRLQLFAGEADGKGHRTWALQP